MKKNIVLFLIITLVIGLCGCISGKNTMSRNDEAIITYLNEKYGEQFSILSGVMEFDGHSGKMERYLCKSDKYQDTFSTIIYYNSDYGAEVISVGNKEFGVEDTFAEVVFENEILNNFETDKKDVIIKCNIDFQLKQPDKAEFEEGLNSCLQNNDLLAYVKFYILSSEENPSSEEYNTIKNWVSTNKPYTAYIYTAHTSEQAKNEIDSIYSDNKENFGNFLADSENFQYVDFSLYEEENGFSNKKVIKE